MKITVDVECTPDEARQFLGLPDVKPLQAAAMARFEKQMAETANLLAPEALLKTWLSFVPQSPEQLRETIAAMFRTPFGAAPQAPARPAPGGTDAPSGGET